VFVVSQSGFDRPNEPQWSAHVVYDAESMQQLPGPAPREPLLESILLPGESGPADMKVALAELLAEVADEREVANTGHVVEPLAPGSRLALARANRAVEPIDIDPNLGESVAAYLARSAQERQLLEVSDLPDEVREALELVPFRAIVIHGIGYSQWAVGFTTSAGVVGPFLVDPEVGFTDVIATRPANGPITLVAWSEPLGVGSTLLANVAPVANGADGSALVIEMNEDAETGDVLVVDLTGPQPVIEMIDSADVDGMLAASK
jgi:hypothetical protein